MQNIKSYLAVQMACVLFIFNCSFELYNAENFWFFFIAIFKHKNCNDRAAKILLHKSVIICFGGKLFRFACDSVARKWEIFYKKSLDFAKRKFSVCMGFASNRGNRRFEFDR
jgi:hypothetical protein